MLEIINAIACKVEHLNLQPQHYQVWLKIAVVLLTE